jgi:hypothetical protein
MPVMRASGRVTSGLCCCLVGLVGCRDPRGSAGNEAGDAQAPPTTDAAAVDAWLAGGAYTTWHCEPAPHAPRGGSGHTHNRVCSNDLLSGHGDGEFPVGAAGVKELYEGDARTLIGYAAYRHVRAGAGGETWFWFERLGGGLNAVGLGDRNAPHDLCVGCHAGAGRNGRSGHDLVFTQVRD